MSDKRAMIRVAERSKEILKDGARVGWADYELGLDDRSGNGIEHDHNDLGHCWPMTRRELRDLCYDIIELLNDGGLPAIVDPRRV